VIGTKYKLKFVAPEMFKECLSILKRDGYDAFFTALASKGDEQVIQVYPIPGQGYGFIYTRPGVKKKAQKGV
jgi:hypothetical protein